jgi:hypothetical protein
MSAPIRTGTRQKQGNEAAEPVPGDESMTRADVAPARGGNWAIYILPGVALIGLLAGIWLLALPEAPAVEDEGAVIVDDDAASGGDLGG